MASPKKKLVNLRLEPKTIRRLDEICTDRTTRERRHVYRSEIVAELVEREPPPAAEAR